MLLSDWIFLLASATGILVISSFVLLWQNISVKRKNKFLKNTLRLYKEFLTNGLNAPFLLPVNSMHFKGAFQWKDLDFIDQVTISHTQRDLRNWFVTQSNRIKLYCHLFALPDMAFETAAPSVVLKYLCECDFDDSEFMELTGITGEEMAKILHALCSCHEPMYLQEAVLMVLSDLLEGSINNPKPNIIRLRRLQNMLPKLLESSGRNVDLLLMWVSSKLDGESYHSSVKSILSEIKNTLSLMEEPPQQSEQKLGAQGLNQ